MTTRKPHFSNSYAATSAERADERLQSYDAALRHGPSGPQCDIGLLEHYRNWR